MVTVWGLQDLLAMALQVQAKLKETTAAAEDRAALLQQEASQWRADYAELEKRHRTAEDVAAQRRATADELQRHADLLQQEVRVDTLTSSDFCSQGGLSREFCQEFCVMPSHWCVLHS